MIAKNGKEVMNVYKDGKLLNSVWAGDKIVWPDWAAVDFWTWANYWDPNGGWPKNKTEYKKRAYTRYNPPKNISPTSWEVLEHTSWAGFLVSPTDSGFMLHIDVLEDRAKMADEGIIPRGPDTCHAYIVSNPIYIQENGGITSISGSDSKTYYHWSWGAHGSAAILFYGPYGTPVWEKYYKSMVPESLQSCDDFPLVSVVGRAAHGPDETIVTTGSNYWGDPSHDGTLVIRVLYDVGFSWLTRAHPPRSDDDPSTPEEVTYKMELTAEREWNSMPKPDKISGVLLYGGRAIEKGEPIQILHDKRNVYYMTDKKSRIGEWVNLSNQLYAEFGEYSFTMLGNKEDERSYVVFSANQVTTKNIIWDDGPQRLSLQYAVRKNYAKNKGL